MAKSQRDKGARGEREVVAILKHEGYDDAERTAGMQANGFVRKHADVHGLPGLHMEVKRQETLHLDAWHAQAEAESEVSGDVPVVVYRRSGKPWRVSMDLKEFIMLYSCATHFDAKWLTPKERER
jgi:Holliday junction resolvase